MKRQCGQVLPMWAMGTITTLVLTFLALNYANAVRYQIRAQNAADSAAQAVVAIQAERWNLMNEMLYASNVEEYRIRRVLDGMLLSVNYSGGCSAKTQNFAHPSMASEIDVLYDDPKRPVPYLTDKFYNDSDTQGTCSLTYLQLHDNFTRSFNRYTQDVSYLNDVTALSTYTNWLADAKSLLGTLKTHCNGSATTSKTLNADGGDCAFEYTLQGAQQRTNPGLLSVVQDAQAILVPGIGKPSTAYGTNSENAELFAPVQVDIVTCAVVPPIIPNFGPFHLQPSYAMGRAAATDVQIEQDWFVPGALVDPARGGGAAFQAAESYTQSSETDTDSTDSYDWYNVDFGGNPTRAYPSAGVFYAPIVTDEMSARFGWWNAIPITPFAGAVSPSNVC